MCIGLLWERTLGLHEDTLMNIIIVIEFLHNIYVCAYMDTHRHMQIQLGREGMLTYLNVSHLVRA